MTTPPQIGDGWPVPTLKHLGDVPGMSADDRAGLLGVGAQLALYHVRCLHGASP